MKVTILNGALAGDAFVDDVATTLCQQLETRGWQVKHLPLAEMKIGYCLGCFECWVKTPGVCRIDDAGRDVAAAVIASDLVVYLTPITFGGYSSELKKGLDRIICLVSPFFARIEGEVHHRARYDCYPALLGLGVLPQPHAEQEQIFSTLIGRNALNMHAPAHDSLVAHRSLGLAAVGQVLGPALDARLATLVPAITQAAFPVSTSALLHPAHTSL
jgi:hypothetical protein